MRRRVGSSAVTRPQIKSMAIPATNVEIDGIRGAVASMMLSCNLTRSMNWSRALISANSHLPCWPGKPQSGHKASIARTHNGDVITNEIHRYRCGTHAKPPHDPSKAKTRQQGHT